MQLRYLKRTINAVGTEKLKNAIPQGKAPLLKSMSKRQDNIRNKIIFLKSGLFSWSLRVNRSEKRCAEGCWGTWGGPRTELNWLVAPSDLRNQAKVELVFRSRLSRCRHALCILPWPFLYTRTACSAVFKPFIFLGQTIKRDNTALHWTELHHSRPIPLPNDCTSRLEAIPNPAYCVDSCIYLWRSSFVGNGMKYNFEECRLLRCGAVYICVNRRFGGTCRLHLQGRKIRERRASVAAESAATCSRWFLARRFFYPEDGGDTFLRNEGSHKIYTAPHPRRWHSS
jgi:hypothetical protein